MNTKLKIGDACESAAFVENEHGFDVIRIERYRPSEIANNEHRLNLLTDEQWQKFINHVHEFLSHVEIK